MKHRYLIGLGSNQRHYRLGSPRQVLAAALAALDGKHMKLKRASQVIETPPLGPSLRRYANAAAMVTSRLGPPEMLERLQHIEHKFGRRRMGQRWRARVLDLDLVLWSGGAFVSSGLTVPHPAFRQRAFVLSPAATIAPRWRDPLSGLSLKHLHARLTRPHPLP